MKFGSAIIITYLEQSPVISSFVMPTGAHSLNASEARGSELKVNRRNGGI